MPHDDRERDRLDVMHTMIKVLRGPTNKLVHCPTDTLSKRPVSLADYHDRARVLDLGCGTGIWMLDMAKIYPDAQFVGVDIHNMGPPTLLPNISIRAPWDYETIWAMGERSWDLIHLQMGLGSVGDWLGLYRKVIRHLLPGRGWFEQVEIDFEPRCDDGTLTRGRLSEWWELFVKPVYEESKRPLHYDGLRIQRELQAAGFVDIQRVTYQLPLNGWPQHASERRAGMWWNIALSSGHESTSGLGLEAMSLAALCKYGGGSWTPEQVRRLCDEALQQASDPNIHAYNLLHVWWARAPEVLPGQLP